MENNTQANAAATHICPECGAALQRLSGLDGFAIETRLDMDRANMAFGTKQARRMDAVYACTACEFAQIGAPKVASPARPRKGDAITVRGTTCEVVRVYRAGTCDVKTPSGQYLRVTGLGWL